MLPVRLHRLHQRRSREEWYARNVPYVRLYVCASLSRVGVRPEQVEQVVPFSLVWLALLEGWAVLLLPVLLVQWMMMEARKRFWIVQRKISHLQWRLDRWGLRRLLAQDQCQVRRLICA